MGVAAWLRPDSITSPRSARHRREGSARLDDQARDRARPDLVACEKRLGPARWRAPKARILARRREVDATHRTDRAARLGIDRTPRQIGIGQGHVQVASALDMPAAAAAEPSVPVVGIAVIASMMIVAVMAMAVIEVVVVVMMVVVVVTGTVDGSPTIDAFDLKSAAGVELAAGPGMTVVARMPAAALEGNAEGLPRADRDQSLREQQDPGHEIEERRVHRETNEGAGSGLGRYRPGGSGTSEEGCRERTPESTRGGFFTGIPTVDRQRGESRRREDVRNGRSRASKEGDARPEVLPTRPTRSLGRVLGLRRPFAPSNATVSDSCRPARGNRPNRQQATVPLRSRRAGSSDRSRSSGYARRSPRRFSGRSGRPGDFDGSGDSGSSGDSGGSGRSR
jgi:uncharacterized membrane protein YgcG